jgi:hypothetical protein
MDVRDFKVAPDLVLKATPVFETYWRFAVCRQDAFMRRVKGQRPPWTDDAVLAAHRFTNVYRAADRVSQYLIRNVLYEGAQTEQEIFFRALLFKFFNRIETWERLTSEVGPPSWRTFDVDRYAAALEAVWARQQPVYSAAYIIPNPAFGSVRKYRNHLQLLEYMMRDNAPARIAGARSLRQVYEVLRHYPSLGNFLAFQFAIDLNYSTLIDFSEMEFVVAGPGAQAGLQKCFTYMAGLSEADVIRAVAEHADRELNGLELTFQTLWGRPMQLIDVQNVFCEVDKYARVVHPEIKAESGRSRIKQRFAPRTASLPQWYPPKWGLHIPPLTPTVERIGIQMALDSAPITAGSK